MRKLLVALGVTFVVLLASGLHQAFRYVPSRAPADHGFVYDATELVHRVGAYVFAALAVGVVVAWIRRVRGVGRSTFLAVVVLVVLGLATLAEIITGRGLRWDQLALRAETVGDVRGVVGLDHVKYVLIGTTELSWSEFSSRVFLHFVVFPIGLVICGGVLWFLTVRDDRRLSALAGSTGAPDGNDEDTDLDPVTEASA